MNEDIIQKYCGDIEERIRSCRSRQVAEILKSLLCHELQYGCSDQATSDYLKQKIDLIIQEAFTREGKNKFISGQD